MSQENIEVVRRGYEHFNRTGELDPGGWDADAVFDNSNAIFADPGVYRGLDRIREWIIAQGRCAAFARKAGRHSGTASPALPVEGACSAA